MKYIASLYSKALVLVLCCCFAICVSKAQIIITATGGSENGYLTGDSISFKKKVFHKPQHITYDKEGNLYISSIESNCIYKVEAKTKIVTAFVNTTHSPFGFAFDNTEENLYIGESSSCVEKYNVKTRSLSLFAGVPGKQCYSYKCGDGGLATKAWLASPWGIAVDKNNIVYIIDPDEASVRIVDPKTNIITTFAGENVCNCTGHGDGGQASASEMLFPGDGCFDNQGNLLVTDYGLQNIRKIDMKTGIISTIAGSIVSGNLGHTGDGGPATKALLSSPIGISVDKYGIIYFTEDTYTGTWVRKIDTLGIINTIAGNGTNGYSGDWGPPTLAQFNGPIGVIAEPNRNILILDQTNNVIREIIPSLPIPAITSFTPANACPNTNASITIKGTNFTYATAVTFGGTPAASFTVNNDSTITAVVGSGSMGKIAVVTPYDTAVSSSYFYIGNGFTAYAYVANRDDGTVSVINTATSKIISTIAVGASPIGISVSPDNRKVYITNSFGDNVSVLSTKTNKVLATIKVGKAPLGICVSPNGRKVYLTNDNDSSVSVIDTLTNSVVATIALGRSPAYICVSPDGSKVYTTNTRDQSVSVIDTKTNSVVKNMYAGFCAYGIGISPDGSTLYVLNESVDSMHVFNTATNQLIRSIRTNTGGPNFITTSPDGAILYLANIAGGTVSVMDAKTYQVIKTIYLEQLIPNIAPSGISINKDGSQVYVTDVSHSYFYTINTSTYKVISRLTVGNNPESLGNFIANIPTPCYVSPSITSAILNPLADTITIKLNQPLLCSSLATNGSDFDISTYPKLGTVTGMGCKTGTTTNEVTVVLANPLPIGTYQITSKKGTDGNTLINAIGDSIPVGEVFTISSYAGTPSYFSGAASTTKCAPQQVKLSFNRPVLCSTIDSTGSQFSVSGPSAVVINSVTTNCNDSGLASSVFLYLSTPITTDGVYKISLNTGKGIDTIFNQYHGATPQGSVVSFNSINKVSAAFISQRLIGCKIDTLIANYVGTKTGSKNATSWQWWVDSSIVSRSDTGFEYTKLNPLQVKLIVSNGTCSDSSSSVKYPFIDHNIKASFIVADTICPNAQASFTNNSKGNLVGWHWTFGNGDSSVLKTPDALVFPLLDTLKSYPIRLIVENSIGCYDTAEGSVVINIGKPSLLQSIATLNCSPKLIELKFNHHLLCSTIATDGSNFSIIGADPVTISKAIADCNNGETNRVQLHFTKPILTAGSYLISLQKASDGSQLANGCGVVSTLGDSVTIRTPRSVKADFNWQVQYGCKQDTVQFIHAGINGTDSCHWDFGNNLYSFIPDTSIIYADFSSKKVQLTVFNESCSDTSKIITVALLNEGDSVKASFIMEKQGERGVLELTDFICPAEKVTFKDNSMGTINNWHWDFGNGNTSTLQDPLPERYPHRDSIRFYPVRLIVKGDFCVDTVYKHIRVVPNCSVLVPSVFTPNGDGFYDNFAPLNAWKANDLVFMIFTRWEDMVFKTTDWNIKWDGRINGAEPVSGTYVWILKYTDHDTGERIERKGTVVLIK